MNTTNPIDDELDEVLHELSDSAWSLGLQGAGRSTLADERCNRMTVAKAKAKLLAWRSQGVGEVEVMPIRPQRQGRLDSLAKGFCNQGANHD